jgi:hypothetical protein
VQSEEERRDTERRLHRTGMILFAPLVAAGFIAVGVSLDDGSRMSPLTLLWALPTTMLVLSFAGFMLGGLLGPPLGALVGWAWGHKDFSGEGMERLGVGGPVGGLIAALVLVAYYTVG